MDFLGTNIDSTIESSSLLKKIVGAYALEGKSQGSGEKKLQLEKSKSNGKSMKYQGFGMGGGSFSDLP